MQIDRQEMRPWKPSSVLIQDIQDLPDSVCGIFVIRYHRPYLGACHGPLKRYEIFLKLPPANPIWIESTESWEEATKRISELAFVQPGDYFIFDRLDRDFKAAAQSRVRTLVVDDHPVARHVLRAKLENHPSIEIVGETPDGKEAIDKAGEFEADLIIVDGTERELDGLWAAQVIKRDRPRTRILVLSLHASRAFVELVKRLGLNGYVDTQRGDADLLAAIDAVLHNQIYFPA
jgi:CheY-like chemotaxis protein